MPGASSHPGLDLARDVMKFRAGLEPTLHQFGTDESGMEILQNPYQVMGKDTSRTVGWYRILFAVSEEPGRLLIPSDGYKLGAESNVRGTWERFQRGCSSTAFSRDGKTRPNFPATN